MQLHSKEERLILKKKVYVTDEVFETLLVEKKRQKISMAKIVCNLIIEKYVNRENKT